MNIQFWVNYPFKIYSMWFDARKKSALHYITNQAVLSSDSSGFQWVKAELRIRLEDAADFSEERRDLCVTPVRLRARLRPSQKLFCFRRTRCRGFFVFISTQNRLYFFIQVLQNSFAQNMIENIHQNDVFFCASCTLTLTKHSLCLSLKKEIHSSSFAYNVFDHSRIKCTILN